MITSTTVSEIIEWKTICYMLTDEQRAERASSLTQERTNYEQADAELPGFVRLVSQRLCEFAHIRLHGGGLHNLSNKPEFNWSGGGVIRLVAPSPRASPARRHLSALFEGR